jgi:hypothetical protein
MSSAPNAGLCASCRHARPVESSKGSRFLLCRRAETDSRYEKYPRLPVIRCAGHEVDPNKPGSQSYR